MPPDANRLIWIDLEMTGLRPDADRIIEVALVVTDHALETVAQKLLEEHANHCVAGALASGSREEAEEKTRELLQAVQRFTRTR